MSGFEEFQNTGGVYGAMYVTEDGSAFSWRSRRYSVEDAKAAAKVDCEAFYRRACELYATLSPAKTSQGAIYFPDHNIDQWESAVQNTQAGNYIAIAVSQTGASGFAWDFATSTEARTAALATCANKNAQSKDPNVRVATANEKAGIYRCRVLATFR